MPHTRQVPCVAGRLFFIVTCLGFFISLLALHFIQYACIVSPPLLFLLSSSPHPYSSELLLVIGVGVRGNPHQFTSSQVPLAFEELLVVYHLTPLYQSPDLVQWNRHPAGAHSPAHLVGLVAPPRLLCLLDIPLGCCFLPFGCHVVVTSFLVDSGFLLLLSRSALQRFAAHPEAPPVSALVLLFGWPPSWSKRPTSLYHRPW